jgi:hypothetical protein
MTAITVRALAERIREPGDNITSVVDRIRNWTDEGLLTLVGGDSPGTGRRRIYAQNAVCEVVLLSILADARGRAGVTGEGFQTLFRAARSKMKKDLETAAKAGPGERFLVIGTSKDGQTAEFGTTWGETLAKYLSSSKYAAHIVIDLWKVWHRLQGTP